MYERENLYSRGVEELPLPQCNGRSLGAIGFQATHVARAVKILRESESEGCPIVLALVSCIVSCGLRDLVAEFIERHNVVAVVAMAGAIEEDAMKQTHPFYIQQGGFNDAKLRDQSLNRTANILIPNTHYCALEQRLHTILDGVKTADTTWLCRRLAQGATSGWLKAAADKGIPVYCPCILDGSIGDFVVYSSKSLIWDVAAQWRSWYGHFLGLESTTILCLGSGTVKHAVVNPFIGRNGVSRWIHFTVEVDLYGSNAGAGTGELVTWGKLHPYGQAGSVTVWGDLSVNFYTFWKQLNHKNGTY